MNGTRIVRISLPSCMDGMLGTSVPERWTLIHVYKLGCRLCPPQKRVVHRPPSRGMKVWPVMKRQMFLERCRRRHTSAAPQHSYTLSKHLSTIRVRTLYLGEHALGRLMTHENAALLALVTIYNVDRSWEGLDLSLTVNDVPRPLYYAASIGMLKVVGSILQLNIDVNAQGGEYSNALQANM